ncbi:MAG: hypothetical protein VYC00_03445 [Candidatus Neomarinimicrobiota bacterium]|nr:hypothetical protein [Candidatus Neomarinimicrobiota bacterium]
MAFKRFISGIILLPLFAGTPIYLVNLGYQSPKLVAPAVISIIPTEDHRLFQFGIVGWTILLKGEFGINKNMTVGLSQDLSPVNSNASIYQYTNGERDTTLNYENATYLTQFYFKKKHGRNFTSQINLIVRKENVKGLPEDILTFWNGPHFGYSISGTYRNVGFEDFFNNLWDGHKAQTHIQFFLGENAWLKGYISGGIGKKFEKYQTTVSGKYLFSDHLNTVNQFIVGGVWELELLDFLPGSHYGEYRIDNGLLVNGRFEKTISNAMTMEYRAGILTFNDTIITGHGVKIVKVHQGLVLNLGTSITGDALKNSDWGKSIISAGVTFGLM